MKRLLAALALSISLLGVTAPALAGHCSSPGSRDIHECVAHEVAQNDDELAIWIPAMALAAVAGAGLALHLLRRNALPQEFPRSEEEAWADLLGEEAGA